ncbi:MAG: DEAD/DEAH box helicase, partial [Proteobacteria bacterium]|nr:DEAD/DEAH box helicase [Pseudomonadota bacterium]
EADHMFDMGFLPDIRRILGRLPKNRQTLLFSATMPREIGDLARDLLTDPVVVRLGSDKPVKTVRHSLFPVRQDQKTAALIQILQGTDAGPILVFTRTKHRAKRVGLQLSNAGYRAACLQGNLSQAKRQAALDGFRNGRYRILVATDIAARGIDVAKVSHVINYDMPDTTDAYIHRIGRTGRAALSGEAFTFVTHEDQFMVRAIDRVLGCTVERRMLKGLEGVMDASPAPEPRQTPSGYDQPGRPYPKRAGKSKTWPRNGSRGRI